MHRPTARAGLPVAPRPTGLRLETRAARSHRQPAVCSPRANTSSPRRKRFPRPRPHCGLWPSCPPNEPLASLPPSSSARRPPRAGCHSFQPRAPLAGQGGAGRTQLRQRASTPRASERACGATRSSRCKPGSWDHGLARRPGSCAAELGATSSTPPFEGRGAVCCQPFAPALAPTLSPRGPTECSAPATAACLGTYRLCPAPGCRSLAPANASRPSPAAAAARPLRRRWRCGKDQGLPHAADPWPVPGCLLASVCGNPDLPELGAGPPHRGRVLCRRFQRLRL